MTAALSPLRCRALDLLECIARTRDLERQAEDGLRAIWPDVQGIRAIYPDVEQETVELIDAVLNAEGTADYWLYECRLSPTGRNGGRVIVDAGEPTERAYSLDTIDDLAAYIAAEYPEGRQ